MPRTPRGPSTACRSPCGAAFSPTRPMSWSPAATVRRSAPRWSWTARRTRRSTRCSRGSNARRVGVGLATALKARHAQLMRDAGHRRLYTQNMDQNAPILAANDRLRFRVESGYIDVAYDLPENPPRGPEPYSPVTKPRHRARGRSRCHGSPRADRRSDRHPAGDPQDRPRLRGQGDPAARRRSSSTTTSTRRRSSRA